VEGVGEGRGRAGQQQRVFERSVACTTGSSPAHHACAIEQILVAGLRTCVRHRVVGADGWCRVRG
jgi:hypothetical protein